MAVTENQLLHREDGQKGGGPVAADAVIYSGTICFYEAASGLVTGDAGGGGNKVAGIADNVYDNAGGGAGAINANWFERSSFILPGAGFTQADVGKKVYASDNYTVTTVSGGSYIGTITRVVSATEVLVAIDVHNE